VLRCPQIVLTLNSKQIIFICFASKQQNIESKKQFTSRLKIYFYTEKNSLTATFSQQSAIAIISIRGKLYMRNYKEYSYEQIKKEEKQLKTRLKIIFFVVSIQLLIAALSIAENL